MTKIKVVVVGNCQARPIAKILEKLNSNIQVTNVAIVHLLKDGQFGEYENDFEEADYIISQLVADNYPCEFVRSTSLKEKYGDKVHTIVNLYFSGYTPDWIYIRNPGKGTLKGPMSDYHNLTLIEAWINKLDIDDAVRLIEDKEYNRNRYLQIATKSLDELKTRECAVDIKIAKFIEDNMYEQRLFFTFNHPSMYLLIEYSCRILESLKIKYEKEKTIGLGEMLNQFIPNLNCGLEFNFPNQNIIKGVEVLSILVDEVRIGSKKEYSMCEIVDVFYKVYNMNSTLVTNRFSIDSK